MKKISYIYLPLLFLVYVTVEVILKLQNLSICDTSGCILADGLLRFDSIYLNYIGVFDALLILIFGCIVYKYDNYKKIFFIVLYSSILFETIMIAYQYWANPTMCLFCLGVYGFLFTITILTSKNKIILILPFILSNIIALSFLNIPKSISFIVTIQHLELISKKYYKTFIIYTS